MLKRVLQKNFGVPVKKRARKNVSSKDKPSAIDLSTEASKLQRKRKRGEYSSGKNMPKKQQTAEGSNSSVVRVEYMDYISHLPESVIHLILSLLRSTKDAARTSILSKRWRDMWATFSVLTFDQRKFQEMEGVKDMENKDEMFREFIDKSLQSLLKRNLGIQKLVLHLNSYDAELPNHLERWIGLATENKVKELGFHVHMKGKSTYTLPRSVFAAETITALRLEGCRLEKLESCSTIKLPHLQKLYLRNLHVDELIMATFVSNCPLIEDLRLIRCAGLKYLQISSLPKLDRLEVHYCHGLKKIEVKARGLQTLWYCGKKYTSCKIFLVDCDSLKRLTLEDHRMKNEVFQKQFYSFPMLEKLELSKCVSLGNIRIASHRLKRLVIRGCRNLQEVEIDTPNLLSFEYQGDNMPFTFLNSPQCLKEAKLSFKPEEDRKFQREEEIEPSWAPELQEFIQMFMNEGFKLVVHSNKNVIIHDGVKEVLLAWCNGLKMEIFKSAVSTEEILDSSLQKQHTETLSILSASGSEFPELVREKINNRKKDLTCCTSNNSNNKCWRHSLKNAKIVNLKAVNASSSTSIVDRLKERLYVHKITCFRLNWKLDKGGRKASLEG